MFSALFEAESTTGNNCNEEAKHSECKEDHEREEDAAVPHLVLHSACLYKSYSQWFPYILSIGVAARAQLLCF